MSKLALHGMRRWARAFTFIGVASLILLGLTSTSAWAGPANDATNQGHTGITVKNYWGSDMVFTIADNQYTVPANGQLFIALDPGDYTFSANVPGNDDSARDGEITVATGQVWDMPFAMRLPVMSFLEQPASPIPVSGANAPSTSKSTGQPGQTGLLVKNYWGDTLNFTIADTEYQIAAGAQQFIPLAPGDYTYSANVSTDDDSAQTGEFTIDAGQSLTLSSYLHSPALQ